MQDWILFLPLAAGDVHPSFQAECSRQLADQGPGISGLADFGSYGFQLLVGVTDPEIEVRDGFGFATVDFIVPPAFSFPITICWQAAAEDLAALPFRDVSGLALTIGYTSDFPDPEELAPYLATARNDHSHL
jgi:hypothetical protein